MLWSQLCLTGKTGRLFARTLLERAKGTPLDITADYNVSPIQDDVTLLPLFAQQIRSLRLRTRFPDDIRGLSMTISGSLPLLHTLEINPGGYPSNRDPRQSLHFFKGAVNLKNFILHTRGYPSLHHFAFPNLTTLEFSTCSMEFPVSRLLNFLEASPALRQIWIKTGLFRKDAPPERIIVLSDVESFSLVVKSQPTYHVPLQSAWNSHVRLNAPGITITRIPTLHRFHGTLLFVSIRGARPSELCLI